MNFTERIDEYRARIDGAFSGDICRRRTSARLFFIGAMRYSALGSGKRLRPLLTYATAETLGIDAGRVDPIAAAIEFLHAYSLVHDDLPSMDDDDLRRGRPTTHIAYDEATAILVGDALQALAFQVLAADSAYVGESGVRCRLISALADAAGSLGMVGGQAMDLALRVTGSIRSSSRGCMRSRPAA